MERMILHEGVYFDRFHCFRVYRNLLFHLADLSVQKSFYRIHYRLFSRRCMLRCVQICLLHRGGNCLGSAVCRCVWYRGIYSRHLSETPECKCLKFLHMSTNKVAPDDSFLLGMDGLMRLSYCYGTFTEETAEKLREKYPYIEINAFETAF